jgi:hypothetical protein
MKTENKSYQRTTNEYARAFSVDHRTVERWKSALAPLDDPRRMRFFLASRKNVPESAWRLAA